MGNSNVLFESIFKQKLSDADTLEYLTQITKDHPYFTPAHFFLLLKTEKDTNLYEQHAARTSLLFNNPYWLQLQLEEHATVVNEMTDTAPAADFRNDQQVLAPKIENDITTEIPGSINADIINDSEATGVIAAVQEVLPGMDLMPETDEVSNEIPAVGISEIATSQYDHEYNSLPANTEGAGDANPETDAAVVSIEQNFEEQFNLADQIMFDEENIPVINEPADAPIPEHQNELNTDHGITGNSTESVEPDVAQNTDVNIDSMHTVHFNNEDSPLINEPDTEETGEETISENEAEPLRFKLNIDTANTSEDQITFEPLHTSDYFASLGIKLSGEIISSDKFGKQLKSFTEWLKTMKKIHGDQLVPPGGQADVFIQKLAEQSNKEAGVVTEAMADVLLQQGKAEKAIEVYKKLSLLNPSKSAYFAAKIDQLKEH